MLNLTILLIGTGIVCLVHQLVNRWSYVGQETADDLPDGDSFPASLINNLHASEVAHD